MLVEHDRSSAGRSLDGDVEALIKEARRRTRRRRARIVAASALAVGVGAVAVELDDQRAVRHPGLTVGRPVGYGERPCTTSVLALSVTDTGITAAGIGHAAFVLRDTGARSCTLSGIPTVALTNPGGKSIYMPPQVQATHDGRLVVHKGGRVSFWVQFLAPNGDPIANATGITVSLPGIKGKLRTRVFSEADTGQQLIVSALALGVVSGLPRSSNLAPTCAAGSIAVTANHMLDVAMPGGYVVISLKNIGTSACSLEGAPKLTFLDAAGERVGHQREVAASPAAGINLNADSLASFWVFSPMCPQNPAGVVSTIRGREVITLDHLRLVVPSGAGYIAVSGASKCALNVSPVVDGVFHMAPGFTTQ